MLKLYGVKVGETCTQDCGDNGDLLTDTFHLSKTRAAFHLLSKMRDRLTEDMRLFQEKTLTANSSTSLSNVVQFTTGVSSHDVCVDVTAHCLFMQVEHQLKHGGNIFVDAL